MRDFDYGTLPEAVRDEARRHAEAARWLQTNRTELNAMTTPEFLAWLGREMAPYEGKVIPPEAVLQERLAREVRERLHQQIVERVLREAGVQRQVEEAFARLLRRWRPKGRGCRDW